jgi:hypothetical protein
MQMPLKSVIFTTKVGFFSPGLPDGLFSNPKSQFEQTLEGLAMEDVGIFYVHLVNFLANWHF